MAPSSFSGGSEWGWDGCFSSISNERFPSHRLSCPLCFLPLFPLPSRILTQRREWNHCSSPIRKTEQMYFSAYVYVCVCTLMIFSVERTLIGSEIFLFYKSSIYLAFSWEYHSLPSYKSPQEESWHCLCKSQFTYPLSLTLASCCCVVHRTDEVHQPATS